MEYRTHVTAMYRLDVIHSRVLISTQHVYVRVFGLVGCGGWTRPCLKGAAGPCVKDVSTQRYSPADVYCIGPVYLGARRSGNNTE